MIQPSGVFMKKLLAGTICATAMLLGSQAFAADATPTMSKNATSKSAKHDAMMKDCMTKQESSNTTSMTHDQMMKNCQDHMKMMHKGSMSKDSMSKDAMKKPATPPAN